MFQPGLPIAKGIKSAWLSSRQQEVIPAILLILIVLFIAFMIAIPLNTDEYALASRLSAMRDEYDCLVTRAQTTTSLVEEYELPMVSRTQLLHLLQELAILNAVTIGELSFSTENSFAHRLTGIGLTVGLSGSYEALMHLVSQIENSEHAVQFLSWNFGGDARGEGMHLKLSMIFWGSDRGVRDIREHSTMPLRQNPFVSPR